MNTDIVIVGPNTSVEDKRLVQSNGFNVSKRIIINDDTNQFTMKKTIIEILNTSIDKLRIVFLASCPLMLGLLAYYNGFIDSEKDSKIKILEQKDISIFVLDCDKNIIEIK